MKHLKKLFAILLAAGLLLSGCGETKTSMKITVVNRTTYPIADLRISPASSEDWGENRLETTLQEGELAEIDLGEFSKEELDSGFQIQFYGEDGEPVNPDYISDYPTFFDSGDFLIFAPPDISTAIFMDTEYDAAVYDQKILDAYESDGDGRGDLIPEGESDTLPVLMGGALPFTGMKTLREENYEDGTYLYEDASGDETLTITNASFLSVYDGSGSLESYLQAAALSLAGLENPEFSFCAQDEDASDRLACPVYVMRFTDDSNGEAVHWAVFAAESTGVTYLYGVRSTDEAGFTELSQNLFDNLYLSL